MQVTTAPALPTALIVRQVVKSYGRVRALDDVSLEVRAGEFVALLGPNGAGKTTLFQLLSGLFTPDAGEIEVMGQDMRKNAVPALAGLGVVFQQPTLDLELTVSANLLFHAGLHGLPRRLAKARVAAVLDRLGLNDRAGEPVRNLSGGFRRRVELARALLHEPSLLLMDEPTVGLDPGSRRDLLQLVREVRDQREVAVLWATHLCDEAATLDRVIVLDRGKVLRDTTPAALIAEAGAADLEDAFLGLIRDQPAEAGRRPREAAA
jgi:ABC-2 type transport system ATP-binding protein